MALTLRDFLRDLGDQLIRIDDEVDPVTQAAALCSAAPRPILLERLRGFPGWKLTDILVKDRQRQALALGVSSPKNVVRELSDRMFSRVPGQTKLVSEKQSDGSTQGGTFWSATPDGSRAKLRPS